MTLEKKDPLKDEFQLFLIGSGSSSTVSNINSNHLFVNTSFCRVIPENGTYNINRVFITDTYLNLRNVFEAKPIPGLSTEKSLRIRTQKIEMLSALIVDSVFMVTKIPQEKVLQGLKKLGVRYNNLTIISRRRLYWNCLKLMISSSNFSLIHFINWIFAFVTNKKPRPKFRPSTGLIALIISSVDIPSGSRIAISGVNTNTNIYGKNLKSFKSKNIHEETDALLLRYLTTFYRLAACHSDKILCPDK
tara:strand:- start:6 stop:746 length:741 start_codon:yes stop_codon:yes gene_type:complete